MINNAPKRHLYISNFKLLILILFLIEFTRGVFILSYIPMLPTIDKIGVFLVSILMSLHFVADAVTNFIAGFLLKKFSKNSALLLSFTIAFIVALFLIFYPTNILILILNSIILGITACPIWIIVLASVEEQSRGKQMGYVYFFWLSGLLLGMVTMNFLFKYQNINLSFLVPLILMIVLLLYNFTKLKETIHYPVNISDYKKKIKKILRKYLLLFPGVFIQPLAIGMVVPILPTYALKVMEVSNIEYTIAIIIGCISCGVSMLLLPNIIDHNSQLILIFIIISGFLFLSLSILSISLFNNLLILCIISIITGGIYGILLPAWNTFMASFIASMDREESWGVFNSVQGIGSIIGMPIGGLIFEITRDFAFVFYFSFISILFLAIFYSVFLLKKHRLFNN